MFCHGLNLLWIFCGCECRGFFAPWYQVPKERIKYWGIKSCSFKICTEHSASCENNTWQVFWYSRGRYISSLIGSECSFHMGVKRISTNERLTHGKTQGKKLLLFAIIGSHLVLELQKTRHKNLLNPSCWLQ